MDILLKELRDEFKEHTDSTLGGIRKDLSLVDVTIHQVHDELDETRQSHRALQKKTVQDVKELVKANEQIWI